MSSIYAPSTTGQQIVQCMNALNRMIYMLQILKIDKKKTYIILRLPSSSSDTVHHTRFDTSLPDFRSCANCDSVVLYRGQSVAQPEALPQVCSETTSLSRRHLYAL
jgi:hypothetical protein